MIYKKKYYLILFIISFSSVAFGAMDSALSSAYLPDILKNMNNAVNESTYSHIASWINFSFLAGGAIGGILLSFISDRIGRRKTILFALLFLGGGCGLGILTQSWQLFSVTRFIVGAGVGAALVVFTVIISEEWPARTKAIALGILSTAYPVGIIASGIITSNVADWRHAFAIGAVPVILAWPFYYLIKEIFVRSAVTATKDASLSGHSRHLLSGILIYGTMLIGLWSAFAWLPTWVQTLLDDSSGQGQLQRGLSVTLLGFGGLIGGIVSGWLYNRWGARLIQGLCFIMCLVLSFLLFKLGTVFSYRIMIGAGLLGLCFGISQGVLNTFIPVLFPANLRSSATALCFHTGRIFTAIAVFFVGEWALFLGGYGNAVFTFSGVYIIGLIALFFMKKDNQ